MIKKYLIYFFALFCCFFTVSCKEKTKNQDVLMVGINAEYPPFEYYEGGNIVGIEIDMIDILGKKLNKQVIIEDMKFNTLMTALLSKKIDLIIAGLAITDERKQQFDFSDPYYDNTIVLVVKNDNDSIKTVDDLKGKKIGAQLGTLCDNYASTIEGAEVSKYDTPATAIINLKAGKVDVIVADKPVVKQLLMTNDNCKIVDNIEIKTVPYGIAINKGNDELLAQINQALKEMKESGELDAIINKHMKKSIDDDKNSITEEVSDNQDATEVVVDIENK